MILFGEHFWGYLAWISRVFTYDLWINLLGCENPTKYARGHQETYMFLVSEPLHSFVTATGRGGISKDHDV